MKRKELNEIVKTAVKIMNEEGTIDDNNAYHLDDFDFNDERKLKWFLQEYMAEKMRIYARSARKYWETADNRDEQ